MEKEIATYSSILAWKILWTKELVGFWSMRMQEVGYDWATKQPVENADDFNFVIH